MLAEQKLYGLWFGVSILRDWPLFFRYPRAQCRPGDKDYMLVSLSQSLMYLQHSIRTGLILSPCMHLAPHGAHIILLNIKGLSICGWSEHSCFSFPFGVNLFLDVVLSWSHFCFGFLDICFVFQTLYFKFEQWVLTSCLWSSSERQMFQFQLA